MIEFCVIVESHADARTATKLAERVLLEKVDWLAPEYLQEIFQWSGLEENTQHSCWKDIADIVARFKLLGLSIPKYLGHRKTGPLKADGAAAMKILNLIHLLQHKKNRQIKAVLFIRDLDNQPERRTGLEQAREAHADLQASLRIIIGTADRMREAWVLNGFVPLTSEEERLLNEIMENLKFDPCKEAHRLRSNSGLESEHLRNPKLLVEKLTGGDYSREQQCWEATSLDVLRSKGKHTGLADYLGEVGQRLVPLPSE